jgi:FKBP-type peptidyl-prolyl cis-trans isomerase
MYDAKHLLLASLAGATIGLAGEIGAETPAQNPNATAAPPPIAEALVPNPAEAFLGNGHINRSIVTLPSGLRYLVLQPGYGDRPGPNDIVTVHHRGWTLSGKEIGNTYRQRLPQSFPPHAAIPAWAQALPLMRVGARWKLFVPPQLAYGKKGWFGRVGPNETLVYELELVDIALRSGKN